MSINIERLRIMQKDLESIAEDIVHCHAEDLEVFLVIEVSLILPFSLP